MSTSAVDEVFDVPSWLPSTPDDTMNLCGLLPTTDSSSTISLSSAHSTVLRFMQQGLRFHQYYTSSTGAQVRKSIYLWYVREEDCVKTTKNAPATARTSTSVTKPAGRLYWSERTRRSISQNRCLPLEKITDIYLGAQTEVLKTAVENVSNEATSSITPNDTLLFSLLSDTTMLDLEAPSLPELNYWLWGLGSIMHANERVVNERCSDVGANAGVDLNNSRSVMEQENVEMSEHVAEQQQPPARSAHAAAAHAGHTRKFSVSVSAAMAANLLNTSTGSLNDSMQLDDHSALNQSMKFENMNGTSSAATTTSSNHPIAPLRHSFSSLKDSIQSELTSMSSYVTNSLQSLLTRIEHDSHARKVVEETLQDEQRKRRVLANKLIELQGNIRVFARVRPMSAEEKADGTPFEFGSENTLSLNMNAVAGNIEKTNGADGTVAATTSSSSSSSSNSKFYEFDRVYTPESTQADVFRDVAPFVQSAVDGYNVCCFAYGQTGAGKSYTMEGPPSDPGVNSRAMQAVFDATQGQKARLSKYKYDITLSVVEIYNEQLRDLLWVAPEPVVVKGKKQQQQQQQQEVTPPKLDVRQASDGSVYVPDLTEIPVQSVSEIYALMSQRVTPNRSVACTNMNEHSSRSHCCVFIKIAGTNGIDTTNGRLVLIDLAGSERISKSGAEGQALKEAQAINTSLSALGNVIFALQAKNGHIPYRNSKLTWLLSDCLSGQSKCLMFVQLSPAMSSAQESSCSLSFAARARQTDLGPAKRKLALGEGLRKAEAAAAAAKSKENAKDVSKQAGKIGELQAQLTQAQFDRKMIEKERDNMRVQLNQLQSGQSGTHSQIQTSLSRAEREILVLKDKVSNQASILAVREREIRDLKAARVKIQLRGGGGGTMPRAPSASPHKRPLRLQHQQPNGSPSHHQQQTRGRSHTIANHHHVPHMSPTRPTQSSLYHQTVRDPSASPTRGGVGSRFPPSSSPTRGGAAGNRPAASPTRVTRATAAAARTLFHSSHDDLENGGVSTAQYHGPGAPSMMTRNGNGTKKRRSGEMGGDVQEGAGSGHPKRVATAGNNVGAGRIPIVAAGANSMAARTRKQAAQAGMHATFSIGNGAPSSSAANSSSALTSSGSTIRTRAQSSVPDMNNTQHQLPPLFTNNGEYSATLPPPQFELTTPTNASVNSNLATDGGMMDVDMNGNNNTNLAQMFDDANCVPLGEVDCSQAQGGAASSSTQQLSVTEAAIQKMQERKMKFQSLKKPNSLSGGNGGGWKM